MRHEFPESTKRRLAMRVAYRCSRPGCDNPTVGPTLEGTDVVLLGVAAHIAAAAPGGPRFDQSMTPAQRSSFENGIWLCVSCATLIDRAPAEFTCDLLHSWKRTAEINAWRDLGHSRFPDQDTVDRFKAAVDLAKSRESAVILHALFDLKNPHAKRNRLIASEGISILTERTGLPLCHESLREIVSDLLKDLSYFARQRSGVYRFVTTNTSVDKVSQAVWQEEKEFRRLVYETAAILGDAPISFDFWRVFLIQAPVAVVERDEIRRFMSTLDENLRLGAKVGVATTAALPHTVAMDFSDFYCVPGRIAFVNVVPNYLAARFIHTEPDDRVVVQYYSEVAEQLVDCIRDNNCDKGFQWMGGAATLLKEMLIGLGRGV